MFLDNRERRKTSLDGLAHVNVSFNIVISIVRKAIKQQIDINVCCNCVVKQLLFLVPCAFVSHLSFSVSITAA